MTLKTCMKCNKLKDIEEFYKHPQMGDGHLGKCKECTKIDNNSSLNGKVLLNCVVCGKEFRTNVYQLRRGRKSCSHACAYKIRKVGYKNNSSGVCKVAKITIKCLNCTDEFEVLPCLKKRKFCSKKCSYEYHVGDKSVKFIHGIADTPEYNRLLESKRRALKRKVTVDPITKKEWEEIKAGYGYKCAHCGAGENDKEITIDHIIPISKGGAHSKFNIQPLCRSCNSKKWNKLPSELVL